MRSQETIRTGIPLRNQTQGKLVLETIGASPRPFYVPIIPNRADSNQPGNLNNQGYMEVPKPLWVFRNV